MPYFFVEPDLKSKQAQRMLSELHASLSASSHRKQGSLNALVTELAIYSKIDRALALLIDKLPGAFRLEDGVYSVPCIRVRLQQLVHANSDYLTPGFVSKLLRHALTGRSVGSSPMYHFVRPF